MGSTLKDLLSVGADALSVASFVVTVFVALGVRRLWKLYQFKASAPEAVAQMKALAKTFNESFWSVKETKRRLEWLETGSEVSREEIGILQHHVEKYQQHQTVIAAEVAAHIQSMIPTLPRAVRTTATSVLRILEKAPLTDDRYYEIERALHGFTVALERAAHSTEWHE